MKEAKAVLNAILVGLYPVHWFFTFLYYTDVASLTAVLAMYLACLKKNFWFSAMVSTTGINFVTHPVLYEPSTYC
jgi:alpha-1,2-glucosyltransferase